MKRWQDRGEVQDSDDEELSFSNQHESPEQARKRQKLSLDDGTDGIVHQVPDRQSSGDSDEDGQDTWLRPKSVATYGRKVASNRPDTVIANDGLGHHALVDRKNASPKPDTKPGPLSSPEIGATAPISQPSQTNGILEVQNPTRTRPTSRGSASVDSELSSVLDISPPPPFRFPQVFRNRAPSPPAELDANTRSHGNLSSSHDVSSPRNDNFTRDVSPLPEEQTTDLVGNISLGRRIFRPRKEKQLHPYMFDRTIHQQQFRQRGMRPINIVEAAENGLETQDGAFNAEHGNGWRASPKGSSSPSDLDSSPFETRNADGMDGSGQLIGVHAQNNMSDSDNDLPDLDQVLERNVRGNTGTFTERRKMHHPSTGKLRSLAPLLPTSRRTEPRMQELSVPLSPPPTSSDSNETSARLASLASFRLPFGVTPAPLPTPQISSEVRPINRGDRGREFDAESPPRRSKETSVLRPSMGAVLSEFSTDSSEEEPEAELDEGRLQRERKRIKGVLPASWLKIDLRARQRQASPSPSRRRRSTTASSPSPEQQRGVAQRITGRATATPRPTQTFSVSDDSEAEEETIALPAAPKFYLPKSNEHGDRLIGAPTADIDDDPMELDWVDLMLAGPSRHASKRVNRQKRQPRISEAFERVKTRHVDFSEEHTGLRHAAGRGARRRKPRVEQARPRTLEQSQVLPRLSILDVAPSSSTRQTQLPQFIRLARRQARERPDQGRHTPSHKALRLATKDDTNDVGGVLSAWRGGTLALVHTPNQSAPGCGTAEDDVGMHSDERVTRAAPLETEDNQQQRLPSPLRRERFDVSNKKIRTTALPFRRARHRQTRLEPILLARESAHQHQQHEVDRTPQRHDNATQRQGRRLVRLQPSAVQYRGAQLEMSESVFDQGHRNAVFERRMQCLTESIASRSRRARTQPAPLARFLVETCGPNDGYTNDAELQHSNSDHRPSQDMNKAHQRLPHRPRKRHTQHIDADTRLYRQPSEPLPDGTISSGSTEEISSSGGPILQGLGPFGTRYATDFDIQPLAVGTFFHESTFIGSGDFAASLDFASRDLDIVAGRIRIHISGQVLELGAWNEEVAAGIAQIPGAVSEALQTLQISTTDAGLDQHTAIVRSNVEHMLRSVVRYCSRCLAFMDPVDRRSCVRHLQILIANLLECATAQTLEQSHPRDLQTRILLYALVIASQSAKLADHHTIDATVSTQALELFTEPARRLVSYISPTCLRDLRSLYEDNRRSSRREAGFRDSDLAASCIVVLSQVLPWHTSRGPSFWRLLSDFINVETITNSTVASLDQKWYDVFTILPFLEIDACGIARPGARLQHDNEGCIIVRPLLQHVFEIYAATSAQHGSTMNDYVRATLARCHRLISNWGWRRCESILSCVFDFFARRSLMQLHREESRGSPRFLDELDGQPLFEVQPEDRSFQIFLKMLAVALHGMRKPGGYSDKKIGGISWRLIPNHGRTHRRDADIEQTDIDALRNHHDLLCTLYYASPAGYRPGLDLVRNLVDHATSHREACRLNVKAWTHLACFQASTTEPLESLRPFAQWLREILQVTFLQYRLAKTEAEHDFAIARAQGGVSLQEDLLTRTIASNQRQIAATMVDALSGLCRALRAASTLQAALCLHEGTAFWKVFDHFDFAERRLYSPLSEALNVVIASLEIKCKYGAPLESQQVSEDSQGFGDSSALQELAAAETPASDAVTSMVEAVHEPVAHLLSNAFGADKVLDEPLLTKLVDTWTQVAQACVQCGKHSWSHYLDNYSPTSWRQLRDTEHKSKYEPYYLARMVERMGDVEDAVTESVLTSWLISLVEREALLKFQHVLTATLLNKWQREPLLRNLPFSKDPRLGHISVTMHELRQRRLTLLSSILANMREVFEETLHLHPTYVQDKRSIYAGMLRQLMLAMKTNYQGLQAPNNPTTADATVQGAYVEFVQQVVGFLQQYANDICKVDPFFLDSSAFPLPVNDPTYVVGKLKGYAPKLFEEKIRKQLVVFVYSVAERAVVDGQQDYLVLQLVTATEERLERGERERPSLREVLMTAIFPPYIESALSTASSWILACPILQACSDIVNALMYSLDLCQSTSVDAAVGMVTSLLQSINQPLEQTILHPGLLELPHARRLLSCAFDTCRSCVTLVDYLYRAARARARAELMQALKHLKDIASAIEARCMGSAEMYLPGAVPSQSEPCDKWAETRTCARQIVQGASRESWHVRDGQYYVKRGNILKEVIAPMDDDEEVKQALFESVVNFRTSYEKVCDRHDQRDLMLGDNCGVGAVMV